MLGYVLGVLDVELAATALAMLALVVSSQGNAPESAFSFIHEYPPTPTGHNKHEHGINYCPVTGAYADASRTVWKPSMLIYSAKS